VTLFLDDFLGIPLRRSVAQDLDKTHDA